MTKKEKELNQESPTMDITKDIQRLLNKNIKKQDDLQNFVSELLFHSVMITKGYYDADFTDLAKKISNNDWMEWLRNQLEGHIFLSNKSHN